MLRARYLNDLADKIDDWWMRPGGEVLDTCIERKSRVVELSVNLLQL